jgi:hypothetical protein
MDFEVYDIRMEKQDSLNNKIKEYLKLFLHKKIEEILTEVNVSLLQIESDPEKLKQDQINR